MVPTVVAVRVTGAMSTVTLMAVVPPYPSLTVTVRVSCLSAAVALPAAARSRAASVGV